MRRVGCLGGKSGNQQQEWQNAEKEIFPGSSMQEKPYRYVLVTPARNEGDFIELTIQSVVAQTLKPAKWVIVNDGSSDNTEKIVRRYVAQHGWIELVSMPERRERHFAGKVHAFHTGLERVKNLEYELIGSLDADISFPEDYFAFLIRQFCENPRLGVAGTPFIENGESYDFRFSSTQHVSGACQLFRRECFEEIGGYTPVETGGIDVIAVLSARMCGWEARTFTERSYTHHRLMGTATGSVLKARFRDGQKDYALGSHVAWEFFRAFYQMSRRPFLIGGFAVLGGYVWSMLGRNQRAVSPEIVQFRRKDQMRRLNTFFGRTLFGRRNGLG